MDVQRILLKEYEFASYNPRIDLKPGDPEYVKLERSINELGFLELPVVNIRTHHVISGHQRIKILLAKGITEIEAVVVDFSLKKEKAANLALNKIRGDWDKEKLFHLMDELSKIPDFDLSLTGFDSPELSQLFDSFQDTKDEDDFDCKSVYDAIVEPVTQKGEIIELGRHRVICGDATKEEDLRALMGDAKADLIDIDWPYNVNYMGGSCPRADVRPKKSRKWERIYSDNLPQSEYEDFMRKVLTNIKAYSKPGAAFYQWQAHRQLGPLYQLLTDLDFYVSSLICWAKESAAISYADYSFRTEQAVYGWLNGASHYFAGKPGESNLWEVKRESTKSYQHPCQKPVILAQKAITNSSKRDEVVLDTFLGSGSVLIGAESLGRRCFGMELDPKYCDVIVRRYISFVGKAKVSPEIRDKYCKEAGYEPKR